MSGIFVYGSRKKMLALNISQSKVDIPYFVTLDRGFGISFTANE
jgi:hypothetical protein